VKFELRKYQQESVDRVLSTNDRIIECAPTGSGKSIIQAFIAKENMDSGKRTAILTPRAEIFDQTHGILEEVCGLGSVGTLRSGHNWDSGKKVHVVSWPTLTTRVRNSEKKNINPEVWLPDVDSVLVDECFVAGTMVGGKPIEDIQLGDFVPSFNHDTNKVEYRRVLAVSKRPAGDLVTVKTGVGAFTCTPQHPIYTAGEYIPAVNLYSGRELVSIGVWHENGGNGLRGVRGVGGVQGAEAKPSVIKCRKKRARVLYRRMQGFVCGEAESSLEAYSGDERGIIGAYEVAESYALGGNAGESFSKTESDGLEAHNTGWERASAYATAVNNCFHAWLGYGSGRGNQNATGQRVSYLLQIRRWRQSLKDWGGNQWRQPSNAGETVPGQKEESISGVARVESVVFHEQGSYGGCGALCPDGFVYNLEVEGNNNYFANDILVHNCHLALAPQIRKVLDYYQHRAHVVGFSATPARKTGKGLGTYFNAVNIVTTVRQLIADGHLCRNEYWGGSLPDLKGIRTQQGDYATGQLSERVALLVGDVVDNWLRLASDRQTIVFAVDIAHAEALMDRFLEVGVRALAVHTRMTSEKRDQAVHFFRSGQIQVIVNVGILTYGFDSPSVGCIVAARPTKSLVLWLQMLGRGMRPFLGKDYCRVLDHADNTRTLGYAEDTYLWELDDGESGVKNVSKEEKEKRAEQDYTCEKCTYKFSGTRECPNCGFEIPFAARDVSTVDADLIPIGKSLLKPMPEGWPDHQNFYLMLRYYAANAKNQKDSKWAWYRYKEKVGTGPLIEWKDMALVPPDQRVKGFIQKGFIAYAKGRGKMRSRINPGQREAV